MSIEDVKRNNNIDKLINSQEELIGSVKSLIRNNAFNNQKDRFMVKKDTTKELLLNNNKILNKLLKISENNFYENKKRNNALKTIAKFGIGGGLLSWLLFGNSKKVFSELKGFFTKDFGNGLLDGILHGKWDKFKENLNTISNGLGDGIISQIITGKYKPLNTLIGGLKVQGGLFQGLLFGDWSLMNNGLKDLKDNLSVGQMGILGALLFGAPIAKGLISGMTSSIVPYVVGFLSNPMVLLAIGAAIGSVQIVSATSKLIEMFKDKSEAKKRKEELILNSTNIIGEKYREKGYSEEDIKKLQNINATLMEISSEQYKKSDEEKIRDIIFKNKLIEQQNEINRKYSKIIPSSNLISSNVIDDLFGIKSKKLEVSKWNVDMWSDIIDKQSINYPNISKDVVKSIIQQESGGNPNIDGPMTKYGVAKGLGQFIDSTAKQYIPNWKSSEDSYDPEKNIVGIFAYMDDLMKKNNGNLNKSLQRYYGSGKDPVLNKTTEEYAKEVETKIAGRLNQDNTIKNNLKDLTIKLENWITKSIDLSENTINKLAEKIAEEGKNNIPKIQNKQTLLVNSRG